MPNNKTLLYIGIAVAVAGGLYYWHKQSLKKPIIVNPVSTGTGGSSSNAGTKTGIDYGSLVNSGIHSLSDWINGSDSAA